MASRFVTVSKDKVLAVKYQERDKIWLVSVYWPVEKKISS